MRRTYMFGLGAAALLWACGEGTTGLPSDPLEEATSSALASRQAPGSLTAARGLGTVEESREVMVAAITVNGFYRRTQVLTCPVGDTECALPGGYLEVKCDNADVATGGGAWMERISNPSLTSSVNDKPVGVNGWRLTRATIPEDWKVRVRVICADV